METTQEVIAQVQRYQMEAVRHHGDLNTVEIKKGHSVTDGVYRGGKVFTRTLVSLTKAGQSGRELHFKLEEGNPNNRNVDNLGLSFQQQTR